MVLKKHAEVDPEVEALAQSVIGAAIEVHRELGPGFLEGVYERALSIELSSRGIEHCCQYPVQAVFKGAVVGEGRVDILVQHRLVLELKTVEDFEPIHTSITASYLKALDLRLGLLINFRKHRLVDGLKRVIYTPAPQSSPSSRLRVEHDG